MSGQREARSSEAAPTPEAVSAFPRTLRLVVAYDGSEFVGWQIQPNGPTVQQALWDALRAIVGQDGCKVPTASGRTDSGVHALAQVVGVRTNSTLPCDTLLRAVNAKLPASVVVRSVSEASPDFDPVRHAKRKTYRYLFHDGPHADPFLVGRCWKVRCRLDVGRMRAGAIYLVGRHDFRCFETEWPNRASSVRTIVRCDVDRLADLVVLEVQANGFLYNMARAIAGTLYEVGRGKWPPDQVERILAGGDRAAAGPTAPPEGLTLIRVEYGTSEDADTSPNSRPMGLPT